MAPARRLEKPPMARPAKVAPPARTPVRAPPPAPAVPTILAPGARRPEESLLHGIEEAMRDLERRVDLLVRGTLGADRDLWMPVVQGLALTPGPDGLLHVRPFGHHLASAERMLEGWREPLLTHRVDPYDRRVEFRAELPGVRRRDIRLDVRAEGIRVEADSCPRPGERLRYRAESRPGVRIDPATCEARYEDGLLVVACRLARAADAVAARRVEVA